MRGGQQVCFVTDTVAALRVSVSDIEENALYFRNYRTIRLAKSEQKGSNTVIENSTKKCVACFTRWDGGIRRKYEGCHRSRLQDSHY